MKRIKLALILLSVTILMAALAGCSGKKAEEGKNSSITEDGQTKQATSETSVQNEPEKSPDTSTPDKKQYAVIETNKGKVVFQLLPNKAPKTVDNFVRLANSSYFNGIRWHRVEPGNLIQGGDPLSKDNDPNNDGLGGLSQNIPAEFDNTPQIRGTVGLARRLNDPSSGGSQFYICTSDQHRLDGKFTVFGQVTEGMDVVDKIQKYDIMEKVYIEQR